MISAVIWDVDGVLVDSLGLRLAGLRHAAESSGASVPSEADLRRWLCHNPRVALQNMRGVSTSPQAFEDYCRRIARENLVGFTGIDQMLQELRRSGVKQGLVTSRNAGDTRRWLSLCDVPDVFDVKITYSRRLRSKPHPDGLLAAADRLGVAPEESVYLGDTIEDGMACERARMPFLLAGWGTPDSDEVLSSTNPVFVAESPADALSFILGTSA